MPDLDVTRPWSFDRVIRWEDVREQVPSSNCTTTSTHETRCVGVRVFAYAADRRLIDEALNAVELLARVYETIPARYEHDDPMVVEHAKALNAIPELLSRIRGTEAQQDGN